MFLLKSEHAQLVTLEQRRRDSSSTMCDKINSKAMSWTSSWTRSISCQNCYNKNVLTWIRKCYSALMATYELNFLSLPPGGSKCTLRCSRYRTATGSSNTGKVSLTLLPLYCMKEKMIFGFSLYQDLCLVCVCSFKMRCCSISSSFIS